MNDGEEEPPYQPILSSIGDFAQCLKYPTPWKKVTTMPTQRPPFAGSFITVPACVLARHERVGLLAGQEQSEVILEILKTTYVGVTALAFAPSVV
jgi:hypothetical protein